MSKAKKEVIKMNQLQKDIKYLSKETQERIKELAKTETKEILKQAIAFAQCGGDY